VHHLIRVHFSATWARPIPEPVQTHASVRREHKHVSVSREDSTSSGHIGPSSAFVPSFAWPHSRRTDRGGIVSMISVFEHLRVRSQLMHRLHSGLIENWLIIEITKLLQNDDDSWSTFFSLEINYLDNNCYSQRIACLRKIEIRISIEIIVMLVEKTRLKNEFG